MFCFKKYYFYLLTAILSFFPGVDLTNATEDMLSPMISVNASGSAVIAPDMAILVLQVVRQGKSAEEALDLNNAAMKNVMTALRKAGIKDRDIQTSNFTIQPRYRQEKPDSKQDEKSWITGYTVYNSLSVRLRDLKILGQILDRTIKLGVNSGGNVRFVNADPAGTIALARARAVKNAIIKAETLAEAANVKLGRLISISEDSDRPRSIHFSARSAKLSGENDFVPLAVGENSYRVTVNASWEINQ